MGQRRNENLVYEEDLKMCWGNDAPELQRVPNPPPIKEMMDFMNYLSGTQTVTVTGADGVKKRVTTRLPRTPEEMRVLQPAQDMFASAVNNLSQLFKYDPKSAISFFPVIDAVSEMNDATLKDLGQFANLGDLMEKRQEFRQMQREIVDEKFAQAQMSNEERLAHSGRGSGTYAAESRAAMAGAHARARREGDANAIMGAEEYAAKRLGTDTNAFGLRQAGRQGTVDAVKFDYGLNKMDEQEQEARRLQAMNETKGLADFGQGIVRYDDWKGFQDKTQQDSLNMYQAENNAQNQRYGAEVSAINANNAAAMSEHNAKGSSFGEWALGTAAKLGGAYLTGGASLAAGGGGGFMPSSQGAYGPRVGSDTIGRFL